MRPTYVDDRLDFLVNVEGIDQLTASQMLYAPELLARSASVPAARQVDVDKAWVKVTLAGIVRDRLGDVLSWLGRTA